MKMRTWLQIGIGAIGVGGYLTASLIITSAGQSIAASVRVDPDDLGGVVASANGPETGAWVIAETTDLPTRFVRIVVTDDRGRS